MVAGYQIRVAFAPVAAAASVVEVEVSSEAEVLFEPGALSEFAILFEPGVLSGAGDVAVAAAMVAAFAGAEEPAPADVEEFALAA